MQEKIVGLKRVAQGVAIPRTGFSEGGTNFALLPDAAAVLFRIELALMLKSKPQLVQQLGLSDQEAQRFMRSKSGDVMAFFQPVKRLERGAYVDCEILRFKIEGGICASGLTCATLGPSLVLVDLSGDEKPE